MPLPDSIPVKISSETAGFISMTPVVRQQFSPAQLIENIVRVTGKDPERVGEILRQGTVVQGASRFRWEPLEASAEDITPVLAGFPDPEPNRPFNPARCLRVRLSGGRAPLELERAAASRKRLFRRRSFWQALLETIARVPVCYQHYSYGDQADVYVADLDPESAQQLWLEADLLPYPSLAAALQGGAYRRLELWVER